MSLGTPRSVATTWKFYPPESRIETAPSVIVPAAGGRGSLGPGLDSVIDAFALNQDGNPITGPEALGELDESQIGIGEEDLGELPPPEYVEEYYDDNSWKPNIADCEPA